MDKQLANNSLHITPEGIIVLTQTGYQNATSIGQFQAQIDNQTEEFHKQGKKALILVDVSGVTGHDAEARHEGVRRMIGSYDALAVFGQNEVMSMIINWVINTSQMGEKVKFFNDREQAVAWLLSHQQ